MPQIPKSHELDQMFIVGIQLNLCLKATLKICFQDQLSLNAGQKYCRMLQVEHSAILSTFIKLPIVIKIFVCLFFSGCFTQVSLHTHYKLTMSHWLMMSYCDRWMSVVRRQLSVINNCFKGHLLNYRMDIDQTWQE